MAIFLNANYDVSAEAIVPLLMKEYLFPASRLIFQSNCNEGTTENHHSHQPKCTGLESRLAAYKLIQNLTLGSKDNVSSLVDLLISLHHQLNKDSIKELEV